MKHSLWPDWLRHYPRAAWTDDLIAGMVVTVLVIPQSLAYAIVAGLPPTLGLYASVWPVLAYAWLGTSFTLGVGPVAVNSLMSASAIYALAAPGSPEFVALSIGLAGLSGLMLLAAGWMRLGFLAYFLSHPVISGFVSGASVLIIISQLQHLLGLGFVAHGMWETLAALWQQVGHLQPITTAMGLGSLVALWLTRCYLPRALMALGTTHNAAQLVVRVMPLLWVVLATLLVMLFDWDHSAAMAVVGTLQAGAPPWVGVDVASWSSPSLWMPAFLIALVSFVESVSLAQAFAKNQAHRIDPNRELLALGLANVSSALSGAFSVAGGFSRTVVNHAAGARTPMASVITCVGMLLVLLFFSGIFERVPLAVLSASITVSVLSLVDVAAFQKAWRYDRAEAASMAVTFVGVLLAGVEKGIVLGVMLSLAVIVWRSSRPHMAVVGRMPGTQHFRNVDRQQVETLAGLLALRVDESLFFANTAALQDKVEQLLQAQPQTHTLLLILSAVNRIDATALQMLDEMEQSLALRGVTLSLAEIKGPVMDRLATTEVGQRLAPRVFLSTHDAFTAYASAAAETAPTTA